MRIAYYIAKSQGKLALAVMNNDGSEQRTLVTGLSEKANSQPYRWSPLAVEP